MQNVRKIIPAILMETNILASIEYMLLTMIYGEVDGLVDTGLMHMT
jgi:hypothetical protein